MDVAKKNNILTDLVDQTQEDREEGLAAISRAIEQYPELDTDSVIMFVRWEAYRIKGMSRAVKSLQENSSLNLNRAEAPEIEAFTGITQADLDFLELAFKELAKITEHAPTLFHSMDEEERAELERSKDLMGAILERCRPGVLEKIAPGFLKLKYLGTGNITVPKSINKSLVAPYLELPLKGQIDGARGISVQDNGEDYTGRKYIWIWTFENPMTILRPGDTFEKAKMKHDKYIFDDGDCKFSVPQPPAQSEESVEECSPGK